MKRIFRILSVIILFVLVSSSFAYTQPILEYVNKSDEAFKWEVVSKEEIEGLSIYEIDLQSQIWEGILWTHKLIVGVPKNLMIPNMALLFITGSWRGTYSEEVGYIEEISKRLGTISAVLFDVPNQPLFGGLSEDALIAYTFSEFVKTQDEELPLLLPMTKSAVKAMDAVQEFSKKELSINLDSFVVTGASKRGWTTWLTGACDKRVKGIAPIVYDNLNLISQLNHQKEIWGDYSVEISDYTSKGLTELEDSSIGERLVSIVDPYSYIERITMPKLIINGSNDPYWAIDAVNIYFDKLLGEKYILYVPNSGHNLQNRERVTQDISAFYLYTAGKIKFPKLSWNFEENESSITVTLSSDIQPEKVGIWYALSPDKNFSSSVWNYTEAKSSTDGYVIKIDRPEDGNISLFGELSYNIEGLNLYLCTPSLIR